MPLRQQKATLERHVWGIMEAAAYRQYRATVWAKRRTERPLKKPMVVLTHARGDTNTTHQVVSVKRRTRFLSGNTVP